MFRERAADIATAAGMHVMSRQVIDTVQSLKAMQ